MKACHMCVGFRELIDLNHWTKAPAIYTNGSALVCRDASSAGAESRLTRTTNGCTNSLVGVIERCGMSNGKDLL